MEAHDCCTPPTHSEHAEEVKERSGGGPLVEIFYFDGCPNHHPAVALVERVSR